MSMISEILEFNQGFVSRKDYERFRTDRFPDKKAVILTCMDTRLVELVPRAMNFRNGDVKMIKNAGAIVSHAFGSVMRSIIVAVYELNAQEVIVIGHHDCGMMGLSCARVLDKAKAQGVSDDVLKMLKNSGIELEKWLTGFDNPEAGVRDSVEIIRHHPLLPKEVIVHGLLIHPETGKLEVVVDGYANVKR